MKKSIKKFVSREFIKTVDLNLLKRLIDMFGASDRVGWDKLPADDRERREAIYELFRGAEDAFPKDMLDALHRIMILANPTGARLLHERAALEGVELIPADELADEQDGRHLTPRHIALRAFLDHRDVFDKALRIAAFFVGSRILELRGKPGTPSRHDDADAREAFRNAVSTHFLERYQGRYCQVTWYHEGEETRIMVAHGNNATVANVEEAGEEQTRSWREIAEDSIRYHAPTGWAGIMARSVGDQRRLASLFAEHLLGEAEFFKESEAQQLYTLRPVQDQGAGFDFQYEWDDRVQSVSINEIVVDEGEYMLDGKRYRSPWTLTCKDRNDALAQLLEIAPGLDFSEIRVVAMKLAFQFLVNGEPFPVRVKITPPDTATISDRTFEDDVMEHLIRNGLRLPHETGAAAAAAE
jgi:hypothetical protein